MSYTFQGFPEGDPQFTQIPALFFSEIVPKIEHLDDLKLILHIIWRLDQMEGSVRYVLKEDLVTDDICLKSLHPNKEISVTTLDASLDRLSNIGILLEASVESDNRQIDMYFLNTPKGRAALDAIARGNWHYSEDQRKLSKEQEVRPNIYRLYEENVGPLTPLIADALADAEESYPAQWIEDAFRIAVEKNNRNWRYIAAILDRWQQKGRYERQDRRDSEEARRKYADWED